MKKLQSNFTTMEQSKRLLELGVPRRTADEYRDSKGFRHSLEGILDIELFFQNFPEDIPCWSTGRLMEIYGICRCYDGDWDEVYRKETFIETYVSAIEEAVSDNMLDFSNLEE